MEEKQEALDILFGENNEKLQNFKDSVEYESLPEVLKSPITNKSKKIKGISGVIETEEIADNTVDDKITNNNLEIYNYEKDKDHTKEEIEVFIIGNDIKDKINAKYQVLDEETQRDITYKDFCILMDRTSSFDIYKKVFDYLQIPLNIYKDEDILFTDEVCLINNILGLIINIKKEGNSTSNKFYYTSIARSYLYSI